MRREFLVLWVPANDLLADASVQCVYLMSAPGLKLAQPRQKSPGFFFGKQPACGDETRAGRRASTALEWNKAARKIVKATGRPDAAHA